MPDNASNGCGRGRRARRGSVTASWGLGLALLLGLTAAGCQAWPKGPGTKATPQLQYRTAFLPEMYEGPPVQPQSVDPLDHNAPETRTPPNGTVAVNYVPYPLNDDQPVIDAMQNPLPTSMQVLNAGRKYFNTYCIVCHGPRADGLGLITPYMVQPPPLFGPTAMAWSDGRIFYTITNGFGRMPSYRTELDPAQRWAIVHYVRVLQRAAHPTAADLALAQQEGMDFSGDYPSVTGPKGTIPGVEAIPKNPAQPQP